MSTRHRRSYRFDCVSCGQGGVVTVIEDAGPPFDDNARRTYQLSGRFEGDTDTCSIHCGLCDAVFTLPPSAPEAPNAL